MNKTKQAGFTLIELIIVIVILGILAVTASPKFLDLTGDAKESAVKGLAGALNGSANIVYSRAIIDSQTGVTGTVKVSGADVALNYGYPAATQAAITSAADVLATEWDFDTTGAIAFAANAAAADTAGSITITPQGVAAGTDCEVVYTSASSTTDETGVITKASAIAVTTGC